MMDIEYVHIAETIYSKQGILGVNIVLSYANKNIKKDILSMLAIFKVFTIIKKKKREKQIREGYKALRDVSKAIAKTSKSLQKKAMLNYPKGSHYESDKDGPMPANP